MANGAYVPSSPPRAPRYGLVASVGGETGIRQFMEANPSEGGPERWAGPNGISWNPYECSSATSPFRMDCGFNPAFTQSDWPAAGAGFAFGIWDSVSCSTLGSPMEGDIERARQKLLISTSLKVESEFWKGTIARTAGGPAAQYLAVSSAVQPNTTVATKFVTALTDMQQAMSTQLDEARAFIYAVPRVIGLWSYAYLVRRENGLILDIFDNVIVPMAGGDGSSPTNVVPATKATSWIYGTAVPQVRLSDIVVDHVVDQTNNVDRAVASRAAAVTFDCGVVGINVDTTAAI